MLRGNSIKDLQNVRGLPQPVTGASTGLVECEVVVIGSKHTVDVRSTTGRGGKIAVSYPLWYEPTVGDRVLVAEIQGDERLPVVVVPMRTKSNGIPKIKT
jgi:hypothetical protein